MIAGHPQNLAAIRESHGNRSVRSRVYVVWSGYLLSILVYAVLFGVWQVEPVPLDAHLIGVLT